jgi:hypothetical protein
VKSPEPTSANSLQTTADNYAAGWSTDAMLITLYGGEYYETLKQDMHPGPGFKHYCSRDDNMNDGKCYFWTFTYYSDRMNKLFSFNIKSDNSIISDYARSTIESDYYDDKTINSYLDSTSLVKTIKDNGGDDILNNYTAVTVFYWLFINGDGDTIWTVYYSHEGSIIHSIDIDAKSGEFLGHNNYIVTKSSDEMVTGATSEAVQWKNDAKLHNILGTETDHVNKGPYSAPEVENGVITPPDDTPFDGNCSIWIYTFVSNLTNDQFKIYQWSNGYHMSFIERSSRSFYSPFTNNRTENPKLNSSEIMDIVLKKTHIPYRINFAEYEMSYSTSYLEPYETDCIWTVQWFSSPDSGRMKHINAYNGTVVW